MGLFLLQSLLYDSFILSGVSWLLKKRIPLRRFLLAIIASQILSVTFFFLARPLILFIPILTVYVAFGRDEKKRYGMALMFFYIISACLSGAIHILMYIVRFDRLPSLIYIAVIFVLIFTLLIIYLLIFRTLQKKQQVNEYMREVRFFYGAHEISGIGFVDTGNTLTDPLTASPVMIVPACKLVAVSCGAVAPNDSWPLSFSVVDDEKKRLDVFKPTLVLIDDEIVTDVVIGVCKQPFKAYDFLLQLALVT